MDISWIFKKFAAVPVERPQRSHLFIPLFFQFSPLVLPFVSIISSLISLSSRLSLLSRLQTTRVKSKCKNFILSKFKRAPIILISRRLILFLFFFFLFFVSSSDDSATTTHATRWRRDAGMDVAVHRERSSKQCDEAHTGSLHPTDSKSFSFFA